MNGLGEPPRATRHWALPHGGPATLGTVTRLCVSSDFTTANSMGGAVGSPISRVPNDTGTGAIQAVVQTVTSRYVYVWPGPTEKPY